MYKYFPELDKPDDFKVYLKVRESDKKQDCYIEEANIPYSFFIKYENLFKRINFIDMLVEGSSEELLYKHAKISNLPYEQYMTIGYFFDKKDEEYYGTKILKEKINFSSFDLESFLRDYLIYCNCLSDIYPDFKDFIFITGNMIKEALKELKKITTISVPPLSDGIVEKFPNAWYITPSGYLYNTGLGHKEGNLTYPFYNIIDLLKEGKNIPNIDKSSQISDILHREYVTASEFETYSNLINDIPTILTPEVEHAIEQMNNILKMSREELEKIATFPHYRRTYQRNIITIVIGYLAAKTSLFQSFSRLNNSSSKKDIIIKLRELYFDDILVRFCGFHKISSAIDKTITTSSIESIKYFREYLDKDWTLDIIPGIIYDSQHDELAEVDFNWRYISEYLDEVLNEYKGKGKVLIHNK